MFSNTGNSADLDPEDSPRRTPPSPAPPVPPNISAIRSESPLQAFREYLQEDESLYEIDSHSYITPHPHVHDHGVSFVPINEDTFDLDTIQAMHRGTIAVHFEEDTGRSACVYLKLERSNGLLVWCKPPRSGLKTSATASLHCNLSVDIEDTILSNIIQKHESKEPAAAGLEKGYVDLLSVKDIFIDHSLVDLSTASRRYGLKSAEFDNRCCVTLLYGINLNDNRNVKFIFPKTSLIAWSEGLRNLLYQLRKQRNLSDQRIVWLKSKYLQLYYESGACLRPTPTKAIKAFGGRKWTLDSVGGSVQAPLDTAAASRSKTSSFSIATAKLLKKKSTVSLSAIRDCSPKSRASITSELAPELNAAIEAMCSTKFRPGPLQKQSTISGASFSFVGHFRGRSDGHSAEKEGEASSACSGTRTANDALCPTGSNSPLSSSCENVRGFPIESPTSHGSPVLELKRDKSKKGHDKEGLPLPSSAPGGSFEHKVRLKPTITHSSQMHFVEFMELFRSFMIRSRRDLKDLFEQMASKNDMNMCSDQQKEEISAEYKEVPSNKLLGILTRNFPHSDSEASHQRSRICDAIATASIVANCAGVDTMRTLLLIPEDFQNFLRTFQGEELQLEQVKALIRKHEPDPALRRRACLSFEGFACYLMDKDNYAFSPEMTGLDETEMNEPLSHYFVATSHNTYLTGHQLKGESSVDLYSQVLLTGCRCVELDCWDGDDGMPVIYHGHTLTSKIPFKKVVETINEKAFVVSPYPIILSIENHCSLQQQTKMAQTFISVFGEKLVTKFLFDADYSDEPRLPSPNQLKYRILVKNKKLRAPLMRAIQVRIKSASGIRNHPHRTNSLVSTTSMGSLNEDEDDLDEDDDEDDDDMLQQPLGIAGFEYPLSNLGAAAKIAAWRTDSSSSQEGGSSTGGAPSDGKQRGRNEPIEFGESSCGTEPPKSSFASHNKVVRKSSSQVAPELSDLVIYCQAVKFRGFLGEGGPTCLNQSNTGPPQQAMKKIASKKSILTPMAPTPSSSFTGSTALGSELSSSSFPPLTPTLSSAPAFISTPVSSAPTTSSHMSSSRRPCVWAPCYQVASLNENSAKKLCRKNPLTVISYTESQLMRSYPAGMRIDSSNFNPVIFWAFGLQMVALNYQTEDIALAINKAMFEQNAQCGLVLKPSVMRDKSHMMFGRFNPWEKEFDGLYAIDLTVTVISGQYVCPETNIGSPQVEVKIIGIPVDCSKQRTKLIQRNSLNPIWNDTFLFRVTFADMAFIRFAVIDAATNNITSQRVVPVKALKQGYRHLRLRSAQNQPLALSSIFVFTSSREEGMEVAFGTSQSAPEREGATGDSTALLRKGVPSVDLSSLVSKEVIGSAPVRRRMFFLVVYGVVPEEPSTILKITQESTTTDVIVQALSKASKSNEKDYDYVLIEEVGRSWDKKLLLKRNTTTQRILDRDERPLEAQANWKGEGRFVLKKIADDPSSRAWMSTIKAASIQKERLLKRQDSDGLEDFNSWSDDPLENFLVCVYNVSPDQPYAILKASVSSTAQDIIGQALLKARRMEDTKSFVIVEEMAIGPWTEPSGKSRRRESSATDTKRVLDDHENVYSAQAAWKGKGLFRLVRREEVLGLIDPRDDGDLRGGKTFSRLTRTAKRSLRKLNRISRMSSKSKESSTEGEKEGSPSGEPRESPDMESHANHSSPCRRDSKLPTQKSSATCSADDEKASTSLRRQVHSEGDTEFQSTDIDVLTSSMSSFARLKRLSIRRLKVWR